MTTHAPATTHHLSDGQPHYRLDNSLEPRLTVASGDTVVVECRDGTDGQLTPEGTVETLATVDWGRIHALSGPIAVDGAKPGDVLAVEILDFAHPGWGWTGVWPGFGLLADDFGDEYGYHIWRAGDDGRAEFEPGIRVPIEEFCGIMVVAPFEPGEHPTMPPRPEGGNLDVRHLCKGTTVYFPVQVPGALFSLGDGHLAQGDGEICGTAIEAPLTVTIRLSVVKGRSIRSVEAHTPRPTTSRIDGMGHYVTTGTGPDLHDNAKRAVRHMIDYLEAERGLSRMAAYILCSCAGDLKIAVPAMGPGHEANVSFHMPYSIFVS
jgi:acetamidase/formamidase